jgi:hypothetical protein
VIDNDKLEKLAARVTELERRVMYLDGENKRLSSSDSRREAQLMSIPEMIEDRDQH